MLTRPKGHWFAIQQPEVHLHPKAQAALGDLIHFLVYKKRHNYVIETHSDYLIDRFRLGVKRAKGPGGCRVVFFSRGQSGNTAYVIPIDQNGRYSEDQPPEFRKFFIDEEISLLDV
jgi:predicted ATPase